MAEIFAKHDLEDPEGETVMTDFDWIQTKVIDGAKYSFNATKVRTDHWEVDFVRDGKHGLSAKGNAIKAMAFVMNAFRQFVESKNPKRIEFSAKSDELTRISLYKRLIDRFGGDYYVQHHPRIGMGSAPKYDTFMLLKPAIKEARSSNKSTANLGTTRASANDIKSALKWVSKHAGIPLEDLRANLIGSTSHVLLGKKSDAGDVDVAVDESRHDRDEILKKMMDATAQGEVHRTGAGVFSFAVPVPGDRSVQVDLMFVPSAKWARWSFHSAPDSKYKGAVRSLLFVNVMKRIFEPGKDLEIKEGGETVVRARRSFKADVGLERLFKVARPRRDGKGRTKTLAKVTGAELRAELDRMGRDDRFSADPDPITDPDLAAELMFGRGVRAKDVMSVEQVVSLIKKRPDAELIFRGTMDDLRDMDLEVPPELERFR